MFYCTLLYVHSSIAIILMGEREMVALLNLSSWCLMMVERFFLAVPLDCLRLVFVVFPDHTHLLFLQTKVSWCVLPRDFWSFMKLFHRIFPETCFIFFQTISQSQLGNFIKSVSATLHVCKSILRTILKLFGSSFRSFSNKAW